MLEKAAREYGRVETLGAVVHNEQVTLRLNKLGINMINSVDEIREPVVAISSHGVSPQIESQLRKNSKILIDTTCPFVKRAQRAAKKLSEAGFWVIVFGEAQHPEVKGILAQANNKGTATLETSSFSNLKIIPRRIGILSQTTQIPVNYIKFVKNIIELTLSKDTEIRIVDTICHDIRKRQIVSLELAHKVEMMLVVGGHSSANTKRLLELCRQITEAHLVAKADEVDFNWLKGKTKIGITSGTSTAELTIDEIIKHLETILKG
jgi:4-hydroxy-3-methylbut-2-enyl diphosphate reductase